MQFLTARYCLTVRTFLILLLAVLSLALIQCGDEGSGDPRFSTIIETRDQFGTQTDTFSTGEDITLVLIVENLKNKSVSVDVTFPMHEFVVADSTGDSVIWNWTNGQIFPAVMNTIDFAPGEIKEFEMTWDQTDNDGFSVPTGEYRAHGFLTTINELRKDLISRKTETRSCRPPFTIN